ncbi:hypothetical protein HZB02_01370 [Candidatus Woesearchaeota archaeon]|nr:hypothetical protein [Candidatus Woesearchaeota archaeon]
MSSEATAEVTMQTVEGIVSSVGLDITEIGMNTNIEELCLPDHQVTALRESVASAALSSYAPFLQWMRNEWHAPQDLFPSYRTPEEPRLKTWEYLVNEGGWVTGFYAGNQGCVSVHQYDSSLFYPPLNRKTSSSPEMMYVFYDTLVISMMGASYLGRDCSDKQLAKNLFDHYSDISRSDRVPDWVGPSNPERLQHVRQMKDRFYVAFDTLVQRIDQRTFAEEVNRSLTQKGIPLRLTLTYSQEVREMLEKRSSEGISSHQ